MEDLLALILGHSLDPSIAHASEEEQDKLRLHYNAQMYQVGSFEVYADDVLPLLDLDYLWRHVHYQPLSRGLHICRRW